MPSLAPFTIGELDDLRDEGQRYLQAYATWHPSPHLPQSPAQRPPVNEADFEMCIAGACSLGAASHARHALQNDYRFWQHASCYRRDFLGGGKRLA